MIIYINYLIGCDGINVQINKCWGQPTIMCRIFWIAKNEGWGKEELWDNLKLKKAFKLEGKFLRVEATASSSLFS